MKAKIPQPVHESYKTHRREMIWQIVFPVVLTALLMVGLIVLINVATFQQGGDVARWAAVSTIWVVIPVMIAGLVFFVLLAGLIYLLAKLLTITPKYTGIAQDYVHKAAAYIKRGTEMAVRPVLFIDGLGAGVKRLFGRK
jgi:hypothetical protein